MSMSVKSAKDHLGMLASFVASYENYIQGKVHNPTIVEEDYDQIDPDDLEEMDLQWQLAMVARRAKRFLNKIGRKFVGGKVGFDKSKVTCYNCQGFGHFASKFQRPNQPQNSTYTRPKYSYHNHASTISSPGTQGSGNSANTRAFVV